jgi:hypothetical protein
VNSGREQGREGRVTGWEENTERRLGIVEQKVDKLLDPEIGIYPKLGGIEDKLTRYFVGLLVVLVGDLVLLAVNLAVNSSG